MRPKRRNQSDTIDALIPRLYPSPPCELVAAAWAVMGHLVLDGMQGWDVNFPVFSLRSFFEGIGLAWLYRED